MIVNDVTNVLYIDNMIKIITWIKKQGNENITCRKCGKNWILFCKGIKKSQ